MRENAFEPKRYTSANKIDFSKYDADPQFVRIEGSQMQEIRRRLQPWLRTHLSGPDGKQYEWDVQFLLEKDMIQSGDTDLLTVDLLKNHNAWVPEFCAKFNVHDYEGAIVWRGIATGEAHYLVIQREDYRQKKAKALAEKRAARLNIAAPEGDTGAKTNAQSKMKTRTNVPLLIEKGIDE